MTMTVKTMRKTTTTTTTISFLLFATFFCCHVVISLSHVSSPSLPASPSSLHSANSTLSPPLPSCGRELSARVLWESAVGGPGSPFVSSPILAPLRPTSGSPSDFGPHLVAAAAFRGEIAVLSAETGRPLPGTRWPLHLPGSTVYASPLFRDVDADGAADVVVVTGEGEIHAFDLSGIPLRRTPFRLASLRVEGEWRAAIDASAAAVFPHLSSLIVEEPEVGVELRPRVMATPVVRDLNGDGREDEMILPVTFVPIEESNDPTHPSPIATALVLFNLTSFSQLLLAPLELDYSSSSYAPHLLHPATVVDLDSRSGDVEILVASSSGRVFALDAGLTASRTGFPLEVDGVVTPVFAHDLTGNGRLEIVVADRSGSVHCFDTKGRLQWEVTLMNHDADASGDVPSVLGVPRALDYDGAEPGDELVVATDDGAVLILSGVNGRVLYRRRLSSSPLASGVLVTRVLTKPEAGAPDLVILSADGHLHALTPSPDFSAPVCHELVDVEESSLTSLLSADFVYSAPGHEILVATQDGLLVALSLTPTSFGRRLRGDPGVSLFVEESLVPEWNSEIPGASRFAFVEPPAGVNVKDWTKARRHVAGEFFTVSFEIGAASVSASKDLFRIQVSVGSIPLADHTYAAPGFHLIRARCPDRPIGGHLIVRMTNQHGQVFEDAFPVSLNEALLDDLKWILLAPFLATAITYLVVHGYPPEDDVLPRTVFKAK